MAAKTITRSSNSAGRTEEFPLDFEVEEQPLCVACFNS